MLLCGMGVRDALAKFGVNCFLCFLMTLHQPMDKIEDMLVSRILSQSLAVGAGGRVRDKGQSLSRLG